LAANIDERYAGLHNPQGASKQRKRLASYRHGAILPCPPFARSPQPLVDALVASSRRWTRERVSVRRAYNSMARRTDVLTGTGEYRLAWRNAAMGSDITPEVSALAINVTIPEALRRMDTCRGEAFTLTTLNVRLLRTGTSRRRPTAVPTGGGRGTYVSFPVPDRAELAALIAEAADRAGALWIAHRGLDSARPGVGCCCGCSVWSCS